MSDGSSTTSYSYDAAERMTKAGSTSYAYDNNGNQTSRTDGSTTTNYSYDFENHLIKAGSSSTYQRDLFGRAVSSTSSSGTTDYFFDGRQVLQEKERGSSYARHHTRGSSRGGRMVSRGGFSNTPSYYHYDRLGSVVGLSDNGGAATDAYSYDAFGNQRAHSGQSTQPYGYLGNRYDSGSKLYDFHARTYDPKAGRFASKDPVKGFKTKPQTLNPYSYGVNGPLAHPDPSGRCIEFCFPDPVYFTDEFKDLGGECAPVAAIGAGDQCSSGGGSEEESGTEPVNGVEDFTQNDEAPEPPEDTGGEGDSYLNEEGDQAEQPPLPGMGDDGDEDLPVYTVNSKGNQPNIEANDRYAIEELGAPSTLTYTTDEDIRDANREAACGDFEGEGSCDEYPYRTTYEGAANPDYPYSVADVPPEENSSQGGELGNFYNQYNLEEGDRFRVELPEEE